MDSSWIPAWAQVGGVVSYVLIVVVHLSHAQRLAGLDRVWHLGHVLMSLGMIDMFWYGTMPVGPVVGEYVFSAALLMAIVLLGWTRRRGHGWKVWLVAAVDFAAMVYMFAMMSHPAEVVTIVFTAWTAVESVLWATGSALEVLGLRSDGGEARPGEHCGHATGPAWDLRISLAVMSLGMAYMFLAMQYGMTTMDGMHPDDDSSQMGDMPGM